MISKEAHVESYVKVLRRVADDWESEKRLTKAQVVQLLLVAMELNMTQAMQSARVMGNYFPELQARLDFAVPFMKEMGEAYGLAAEDGVRYGKG